MLRPTRRQLLSCLAVGMLLMGANAVVSFAEVDVPSSMAALLIASVPLWVILYRRALGDRVAAVSVAAVLVGFVGVAILLLPGKQTGGAPLLALLTVRRGGRDVGRRIGRLDAPDAAARPLRLGRLADAPGRRSLRR